MTKASDTRRIRKRARLWNEGRKDASLIKEQMAKELGSSPFKEQNKTARELIEDNKSTALQFIHRDIKDKNRECNTHMRPYYRKSTMGWINMLRNLRDAEMLLP